MRKMFTALVATALMVMAMPVMAEQVTLQLPGELTDQQKAEIHAFAAQKLATNGTTAAPKVETVKEWVEIGTAIGSGLAASAKELGIAANDFAKTPVGKFTVAMIAWHYMGEDFISIVFGFTWLLFIIPVWVWMYRRMRYSKTVRYYEKEKGPNGVRKVIENNLNSVTDTECTMYWVTLIIITVIGVFPIVF